MRPTDNTIESVWVVWHDARHKGTREGWQKAAQQLGGMQILLSGYSTPDHRYVRDMVSEALDMMEDV